MNNSIIYLILKDGRKILEVNPDKQYALSDVKGVFVQFPNGEARILSPRFLKKQQIFSDDNKKWEIDNKSKLEQMFGYKPEIEALNEFNGHTMTHMLSKLNSDAVNNLYNDERFGKKWFIPACGEMTNLMFLYKEINKFLEMVEDSDKLDPKEYYWTSTRCSQNSAYYYDGFNGYIGGTYFYYSHTVSPLTLPEGEDFLTNMTPQKPVAAVSVVNDETPVESGAKKVVVTTGDVTTVEVNGVKIVCKGKCEVVI